MRTVQKSDVAAELLDAAIAEFLDHQRYFAAYHLAAAAEEVFSVQVRLVGGRDSMSKKLELVNAISEAIGQPTIDPRNLRKIVNALKNSIKHMRDTDPADHSITANIEADARRKIKDAIHNHQVLKLRKSALLRRFQAACLESQSNSPSAMR